ncbi:MAG: Zn-ribbon domain-containing OB-fold protein [Gammaproteobacteria bacterium]
MSSLPVFRRGALWRPLRQAAGRGELSLQICDQCQQVQYPPREVCRSCLSDALSWQQTAAEGEVLAWTRLHASTQAFFREHLPWCMAVIRLDCGAVLYAYISEQCLETGMKVHLHPVQDSNNDFIFVATSPDTDPAQEFEKLTLLTQE